MKQPGYGFRNWVWYECKRKKPYPNKKAALASIAAYPDTDGLHAYQCLYCTGWHVGHPSRQHEPVTA